MKYSRFLAINLFLASLTAAAATAPVPPEKVVGLRVAVAADGKLLSTRPIDPSLSSALIQAATDFARKLQFRPATREGRPVASETTLHLTLGFDKNGEGKYSVRLKDADIGPSVRSLVPPRFPLPEMRRHIQAIVVLEFSLLDDGHADPTSIKLAEFRSTGAGNGVERRFFEAATASLALSRFDLDSVDGVLVKQRGLMTYTFCSDLQCGGLQSQSMPDASLALKPSDASLLPPSLLKPVDNRPGAGI
jgi:hypothetical protein